MHIICCKESLNGKSGDKINVQGVHEHRALDGGANNDKDNHDKKTISDLDKKGNPEEARLFKDKPFMKKHAKDNIDSGYSKFFSKADGMCGIYT